MKIVAFGASSSRTSINKQLAAYSANLAASVQSDIEVEILDLNDFELAIFSQDKEIELGQPEAAKTFFDKLGNSDAIIISYAEHNGSYTAAYKNIFDWASRINQKVFQDKPMLLLATSPGPGGAASVLATAVGSAPYFAGNVKASLSVPNFFENFDIETQSLTNDNIKEKLLSAINDLTA